MASKAKVKSGSPRTAAPEPVLRGPAGGVWLHVDGGRHGAPLYCEFCGSFHHSAWCYYVGPVARATICDDCVKEVTKA